jgi:hypothetical protein
METGDNIVRQSKLNIESYVNDLAKGFSATLSRRWNRNPDLSNRFLRGLAIELWSDAAGGLFIVADEEDGFQKRQVLSLRVPTGRAAAARLHRHR